jgi:spore coat polysaccharide biosynthesis protein SpsF
MISRRIVAIIEARMNSTRLPGKVLKPLLDGPHNSNLEILIRRLKKSKKIDQIVIATTKEKEDDLIVKLLENNVEVFRGSSEDVYDRVLRAAQKFKASTIVEITGDCPLVDPKLVDFMIELYEVNELDYIANNFFPVFADGFDVQVIKTETLENLEYANLTALEREHVTMRLRMNLKDYRSFNLIAPFDLRRPQYSVTLDTEEDLEVLKIITREMTQKYGEEFGIREITDYLDNHPELVSINSSIVRKGFN